MKFYFYKSLITHAVLNNAILQPDYNVLDPIIVQRLHFNLYFMSIIGCQLGFHTQTYPFKYCASIQTFCRATFHIIVEKINGL